jgi:suppressor for copper-sensitivity B
MCNLNLFPLLFLMLALPTASARALESPWRSADHVQARLLSGVDSTGKTDHINAALEIKLEDGWHAYWRMAGDGGLAPTFDWTGSVNTGEVAMDYPTPARSDTAGLQSFGYMGSYMLPLTAKVTNSGKPVTLSVKADIMVCKDICIPQSLALDLAIPAGDKPASPDAALIAKAREAVPVKKDKPALKIQSAVVGPDALVVGVFSEHGFDGADLFVEPAELTLFAPPKITPDAKDPHVASFVIPKTDAGTNLAKAVMGKTLVLTVVTKDGAVEKSYPF